MTENLYYLWFVLFENLFAVILDFTDRVSLTINFDKFFKWFQFQDSVQVLDTVFVEEDLGEFFAIEEFLNLRIIWEPI